MSTLALVAYSAVILGVIALVVAAVVLTRRYRKAQADKKTAALLDPAEEVRAAFAHARARLAEKVPEPEARTALGRFLMLGEAGAGKSTLLAATGLNVPLGQAPSRISGRSPSPADPSACAFWLMGKGLVVEARGKLLGAAADEGQDTEEDSFNALLEGLRRDRPDRPLDGVLLTIPCRELLSSAAEAPEEQQRKARVLRRRILEAQRALEMCVPIYLVVTQCDLVTGFASFAAELDPSLRQSVVGWSSPHVFLARASAAWVGEAFDRVHRTLVREQSHRFAADRPLGSADEFFLFPTELGALRGPLETYVEEIFASSAAEEPLTLRGIYFTGDGGGASSAAALPSGVATAAAPTAPARSILFARELLEHKIFAEANIARPSVRAILRRRRGILGLQIAAACLMLFFSGLLSWASSSLEREVDSLLPFLNKLSTCLVDLRNEPPRVDAPFETRKKQAIELFQELYKIDTNRLRTALLPASFPSGIDGRIEKAVSIGYQRVIIDAFRNGIEQKSGPLRALPTESKKEGRPPTLEESPEFQRLEKWLQELLTFEANVARYNGLLDPASRASSGRSGEQLMDERVQSVTALGDYLLGEKVGPSFNAAYYRRALARGAPRKPFALEPYAAPVREKADALFAALHRRMLDFYKEQAIQLDFKELAEGLHELQAGGTGYTAQKLWRLRDAIDRAEKDLTAPALAWVSSDDLSPSPGLTRVLDMVKASQLLGDAAYKDLKARGEASLQRVRAAFSPTATELSDPLLVSKDGEVQKQLAPFIVDLKAPIDALHEQAFMRGDSDEAALPDADDVRITWDVEGLKEVAKLPKAYEAYLAGGGLKQWKSPAVEETIKGLTERTLQGKVLGGVGSAEERGSALANREDRRGEVVRADAVNFEQASAPLLEMVAALARLKLGAGRARLLTLLRVQGGRLLGLAQSVLEAPPLYQVRDDSFSWWKGGEQPPVFEAFGVADSAELTEYVAQQRTRAETLSKELAEPVLKVVQSPEVSADAAPVPGVASWQRVVSPLRDYADKKANNSVSNLERFIVTELPGIKLDNCTLNLKRRAPGQLTTDYFNERRQRIRDMLYKRCVELSRDDILTGYMRLHRAFGRDLAGRFPFHKLEAGTKIEDASPEATFRFLQEADDFWRRYRNVLSERKDSSAVAVSRFLERIDKVRVFLAPLWSQTDAATDGFFEVKVDFRVNQAREVGGNQIAAWSMKIAEERLFLGGPKTASRFRLGDPVRLWMRWAKNSPDVPVRGPDLDRTVKDREVTFEERGSWALLRMIAGHQLLTLDAADGADVSGHVLLFVVRTIPDPSGGFVDRIGVDAGAVRVFVRLGLSANEKDKPLKYPYFPEIAPSLN